MTDSEKPVEDATTASVVTDDDASPTSDDVGKPANEHGGPKGLDPTRYGDWERNGRCYDF